MQDYPVWTSRLDKAAMAAHRGWLERERRGDGRIVLTDENLTGAQAIGDLRYARFVDCDLSGAMFHMRKLVGLELVRCKAHKALFHVGSLDDAVIEDSDLRGANLRMADLVGATITNSCLAEITGEQSSWERVTLTRVDLRGALLADARLTRTRFDGCDLRGADLGRADLALRMGTTDGAELVDCDLRGARLADRKLAGTRFVRCKLHGIVGSPVIDAPIEIVDCDLSAAGDRSHLAAPGEVERGWHA